MKIKIAFDYTETPGGAHIGDGKYSGEDFRNTILEPKFLEAKEKNEDLEIDLDGGYGYGTSFLEEALGGLARKYPAFIDFMLRRFKLKSDDEPRLCEKIPELIRNANEF
jgi:hypothetical protein